MKRCDGKVEPSRPTVRAVGRFVVIRKLVMKTTPSRIAIPDAYAVPRLVFGRIVSCGTLAAAQGREVGEVVLVDLKRVEADVSHYTHEETGTIIVRSDDVIAAA